MRISGHGPVLSSTRHCSPPRSDSAANPASQQTVPRLKSKRTFWGASCVLSSRAVFFSWMKLLSGNTMSFASHPLCCSCSLVSQRMESGSPALVKFCALQNQRGNKGKSLSPSESFRQLGTGGTEKKVTEPTATRHLPAPPAPLLPFSSPQPQAQHWSCRVW